MATRVRHVGPGCCAHVVLIMSRKGRQGLADPPLTIDLQRPDYERPSRAAHRYPRGTISQSTCSHTHSRPAPPD